MPLLRNSTLKQLQRINAQMHKNKGNIESRRNKKEDKFPNAYWNHNAIDAHNSGKRHIATYEEHASVDKALSEKNNITTMIKKFDQFNEAKKTEKSEKTIKTELVKYLKKEFGDKPEIEEFFKSFEKPTKRAIRTDSYTNITKADIKEHFERFLDEKNKKVKKFGDKKTESKLYENGPNDTPIEIMANMKTIANWSDYQKLPNPTREMNILQVGKFVDTGKIRGYIMRIENGIAYVSDIDGNTYNDEHLVKVPLKDIVKAYKTKKEKDVKGDVSLVGPSNASVSKAPKEESGDVGADLDDKSNKAKDQKIANKIYTLDTFKKLDNSDLTPDFDSSKMAKKGPNYDSNAAKDQKITNQIYKVSDIKKLTNLATEPDDKVLKNKTNTISSDLTDKAKQVANADITKKNNKVKFVKENILKSFEDFLNENDSTSTEGNLDGMGNVIAPIVSEIPGQVNILPSQQVNETMSFEEFLNEDGGGVACATMGNSSGMGAVTAPTVSATPGDVAGSTRGSGDAVAHAGTYQNKYQQHIPKKKKKKYNLKPKTKKFEHSHLGLGKDLNDKSLMYVTKFSDWEYPM